MLERFVVLLYDRTSDLELVNDARKWLFTQKSRTLDNIPSTQASLIKTAHKTSKLPSKTMIPNLKSITLGLVEGYHRMATADGLPYQKHQNHVVNLFAVDRLLVRPQTYIVGCTTRCKCIKALSPMILFWGNANIFN